VGERGPPPTPTGILKIRGSWRARRGSKEPTPERTPPRRPKWLDGYARAAWRQVVPLLDAMGVLTSVDGKALARYCTLWGRWRKAEEFLAQHGETHLAKDADGNVLGLRNYPQVRTASVLAEQLLRLEQHFGMTPSARARIAAPAEPSNGEEAKARYLRIG